MISAFHIAVSDEQLEDLRRRLRSTRWPERETDPNQGVPLAYMQELCAYWADEYDWRATEARLNALPQFRTQIDGLGIHFIRYWSEPERGGHFAAFEQPERFVGEVRAAFRQLR